LLNCVNFLANLFFKKKTLYLKKLVISELFIYVIPLIPAHEGGVSDIAKKGKTVFIVGK